MSVQLPNFADVGLASPRPAGNAPTYPQENAVAQGEAQLGTGVQKLGLAISDIDQYQELRKNKVDTALATADLDGNIIRTKELIKNESDPAKIDALKSQLQGYLNSASQGISNPGARQLWAAQHSAKIAEAGALADVQQHKLYNDKFLAGADAQLTEQLRLAQQATDPADRETAQRNIGTILGSLTSAGVLSETAAQKATQDYGSKIITGTTHWMDANGNAKGALEYLKQNAQHIDPATLDSLTTHLQNRVDKQGVIQDTNALWGGSDKGYAGNRTGAPGDVEGTLDLIEKHESKGQNVQNYRYDATHTAQGNFQITNTTWNQFAGEAGVDTAKYPNAMSAPYGVQRRVARTILTSPNGGGIQHWANYNSNLAAALGPRFGDNSATRVRMPGGLTAIPESQVADAGGTMTDASPAGLPPLRDINALTQQAQDKADSGEWTQEHANAVQAGLRSRYNHVQAAQANDRATLTRQLNNGAAMLADGRDFNFDPAQIQHFFPKDKADEIIQQLQDAKDAGQVTAGVRTSSPEDLVRQRQQFEAGLNDPNATDYAKRRKLLDAFQTAADRHFKELDKDPAAYVTLYSPSVAGKFQAIDPKKPETFAAYATAALAEQQRLGVQDEKRSILPSTIAASVAAKIAAIDPAKENPAAVLDATARSYGEYWPQVFGDLVKAKLPATYQVLAAMDRPEQAVAAGDLTRAIGLIAEKGGMSALKKAVPDDTQKAIDKGLDEALADFRESTGSQAGGARLYATVRDGAQALAYYYGFRGRSDSEAVRQAVDGIINAKYDFGKIGAEQVRVPKGALSNVEKAADVVKAGLNADQLGDIPGNPLIPPDKRKLIWLGAIQAGGWANNEDDSGIVLMGRFRDGAYSAVRRADGSRVELKFNAAPMLVPYWEPPPAPAYNGP